MKLFCQLALLSIMVFTSCTTRSKAQARAREAFMAGQSQGVAQANEARRINIRFLGPVRQPEVPWQEGLTLLQAIAAAGYSDPRDPNVVTLIRQRERVPIPPQALLAGKDVPLEPGDTVEIHP